MGCVWSREGMRKEEEMVLRVADYGLCLVERGNEERFDIVTMAAGYVKVFESLTKKR